jgi:hypothetical protein
MQQERMLGFLYTVTKEGREIHSFIYIVKKKEGKFRMQNSAALCQTLSSNFYTLGREAQLPMQQERMLGFLYTVTKEGRGI